MKMKLAVKSIKRLRVGRWFDDIILTRPNDDRLLLCYEGCPRALRRLVGKSGTFTVVPRGERVGEGFLVMVRRCGRGEIDATNYTKTTTPVSLESHLPKNLAAALCRLLPEKWKYTAVRVIFKEKKARKRA